MASLVDTNVLVYAYDPRNPGKQGRALELLRKGSEDGSLVIPHQALVEFVAVVTRPARGGSGGSGTPLLPIRDALREADEFLLAFDVVYPTDDVLRRAFLGVSHYGLPWYDAHLWAYADCQGIPEILSEDFQHGRVYGNVRVVNPFRDLA